MSISKEPVAAKFDLGQVVITPNARDALAACGQSPDDLLLRHQAGDWGQISDDERQINDAGVSRRLSIVSLYETARGVRLSVVTKADRTCTFIHISPIHA